MDTVGFALATAFLASVFTIFGAVERVVVGMAAEVRHSIAPGVVSGLLAWAEGDGAAVEAALAEEPSASPGDTTGDRPDADRHDAGLVVPLQGVPRRERRGWHLFALLIRTLAIARHRAPGAASGA